MMRHNRIKQLQKYGVIAIEFVRLKKNLTNPLTKRSFEKTNIRDIEGNGVEAYELNHLNGYPTSDWKHQKEFQ